jgi:hypothetical protein
MQHQQSGLPTMKAKMRAKIRFIVGCIEDGILPVKLKVKVSRSFWSMLLVMA